MCDEVEILLIPIPTPRTRTSKKYGQSVYLIGRFL